MVEFDARDRNALRSNLKIFSEALARQINGGKKQLSCGYRLRARFFARRVQRVLNMTFSAERKCAANHVAVVKAGRMGPDVAVLDHSFTYDHVDTPEFRPVLDKETQDAIAANVKRQLRCAGSVGRCRQGRRGRHARRSRRSCREKEDGEDETPCNQVAETLDGKVEKAVGVAARAADAAEIAALREQLAAAKPGARCAGRPRDRRRQGRADRPPQAPRRRVRRERHGHRRLVTNGIDKLGRALFRRSPSAPRRRAFAPGRARRRAPAQRRPVS